MNLELPRNGLVTWTSGNVSARDSETGYVVIKPSGVRYADLLPENMVVVDLDGNVVEGPLKPSVDTATHLYVYRHRTDVGGVVKLGTRAARPSASAAWNPACFSAAIAARHWRCVSGANSREAATTKSM